MKCGLLKKVICIFVAAATIMAYMPINADNTQSGGVYANYKSLVTYVGDEVQLTGLIPSDNTATVEFSSDNTEIAEVDANGLLSAKSVGTTQINLNGSRENTTVNVEVMPQVTKGVKLSKSGVCISGANITETISAQIINGDEDSRVEWSSSDNSVATVANGTITGKKNGSAVITAKLSDDDSAQSAKCRVFVGTAHAGSFLAVSNTDDNVWQYMYAEKGTNNWLAYDEVVNPSDPDMIWRVKGDTSWQKGLVRKTQQMPSANYDCARVFNAFADGKIKINLHPSDAKANIKVYQGKQINFRVMQNDKQVFPTDGEWLNIENPDGNTSYRPFDGLADNALYLDVKAGDKIIFVADRPTGAPADSTLIMYWEGFWITYSNIDEYSSLNFESKSEEIGVGEEYVPSVITKPSDFSVNYFTDDTNVAEVNDGRVIGKSIGTCNLYAYNDEGKLADKMRIDVKPEPTDDADIKRTSIGTLDGDRIVNIPKGTTVEQLKNAISTRANASLEIYKNDGKTVASELENFDKCIVTAGDGVTQKTYILLFKSEVVLNRSYAAIEVGDTLLLRAAEIPSTGSEIVYSSSNDAVASVDENGTVTAVGKGTALISAAAGESIGSCTIEVGEKVNVGVKLNKNGIAFPQTGMTETLKAEKIGVGEDTEIAWSSSDETVASVKGGEVISNGNGIATITARVKDNNSATSAECKIMVGSITADGKFSPSSNTNEDIWQYMYAPKNSNGQWKLMEEVENEGNADSALWHRGGRKDWNSDGFVRKVTQMPGSQYDTARVFCAPASGLLKVKLPDDAGASLSVPDKGAAANFKILKNDTKVFPQDKDWLLLDEQTKTRPFDNMDNKALYIEVEKGDLIKFVLGSADKKICATVYTYYGGWTISYADGKFSQGIELDRTNVKLKEGETETVTAKTIGESGDITYQSSDMQIARVDLNGHISGVTAGRCRVYAYTNGGALADYCDVEVTPADLKISKPQVILKSTDTVSTKVSVICNSGNDVNVTLICVARDEDNKAKSIKYSDTKVLNSGDNIELGVDTKIDSVFKTIDVYIWDSIDGLKPLAEKCSYGFPIN